MSHIVQPGRYINDPHEPHESNLAKLSPGLFAPLAQICWDVKKTSHVETSNEVGNLE